MPSPITTHELQRHFEIAIDLAFQREDSISKVCDALVRAIAKSRVRRMDITAAYERNDI